MDDFLEISKYAGMREDLIQAGGGNSSVKISENEMIIKASGIQLAEINEKEGYSIVNQKLLIDLLQKNSENEKNILENSLIKGGKPSIETFLHSITNKVTLHTHPMLINVLTSRKEGMQTLKELFPNAILVPYATPGIELAKVYFQKFINKSEGTCNDGPIIVFLQNHGLVISSNSAKEVIDGTEYVVDKVANYLKYDNSGWKNSTVLYKNFQLCEKSFQDIVYLVTDRYVYEALNKLKNKIWLHTFCPDCIVYGGKSVLKLNETNFTKDIKAYYKQNGKPSIVFLKNHFYVVAKNIKKAKEIESLFSFSAQISVLNKDHEMNFLTDKQQNFLLNWDEEKYRKNLK